MPPRVKAIVLSLATSVLGLGFYLFPLGLNWEENFSLAWLFRSRGVLPAPHEVVLIGIDRASAQQLALPEKPEIWPRQIHAKTIEQLTMLGARCITFDVFFAHPKSAAEDNLLSESIRAAGNVILFGYLDRDVQPLHDPRGFASINIERLLYPLDDFTAVALAVAPFALPKIPVQVAQFWAFQSGAGALPTLPTATLQCFERDALPGFIDLMQTINPSLRDSLQSIIAAPRTPLGFTETIRSLRNQLAIAAITPAQVQQHLATSTYTREQQRSITRLADLYLGPERRYLNFYGPPHTIRTIPYVELLKQPQKYASQIRGKAVFVGFSESKQPDQMDAFYTVYSRTDGLDLSGVEIAATAFANLLDQTTLRNPAPFAFVLLIIGFAILLGALNTLLPATAGLLSTAALLAAYVGTVTWLFNQHAYWLPLAIPLLVMSPFTIFSALLWRYRDTNRERKRIRQAFGYFLPTPVVDQMVSRSGGMDYQGDELFGICLSTDAAQYTRLSETMTPKELGQFMNDYYSVLFAPVSRYQGTVSDVIGDAMLALWSSAQPDAARCRMACLAAVEMLVGIDQFNAQQSHAPLPTRLGLHAGDIYLGNVGAQQHFEYRAVGDIVNTSTRIEALNKQLGTRILASATVVAEQTELLLREVGEFMLAGKTRSITLYEIFPTLPPWDVKLQTLTCTFARALQYYRAQNIKQAMQCWEEILHMHPDDGPSRFYLAHCQQWLAHPQNPWTPVIHMDRK